MDYGGTDGDDIAAALVKQFDAPIDYLPLPTGGADRAAMLLAALL